MNIEKIELEASRRMFELEFFKPPWIELLRKQSVSSEQCRLAGNEAFKKLKFVRAIGFYNGALRYAPPRSKDIALIYGNRSAVYFKMGKYALALENIKLARDSGFPVDKMAKLDDREDKCQKLMETFGPDNDSTLESFLKLSHPPNKKIPFIVDCLELRKNEKYGRHIVTTKDLKTGDIIAIENPVFSWPGRTFRELVCSFCTKKNGNSLMPCLCCTSVMYCSEECQQKDLFHNDSFYEIGHLATAMSLKMQLEAFRVAGGVKELLELLKGNENKTIFDFDFSDPEDPMYEKNMLIALNGLCKNMQSKEPVDSLSEQLLDFPPINKQKLTAEERDQLLKFIKNQFHIRMTNFTLFERAHSGMFLFQPLLNHSCLPNIFIYKFDEKSVAIVARPIKTGEQIFMSYGVHASLQEKEERIRVLQKYQFKCDCDACVNDYPSEFPRKDRSFVTPRFGLYKPAEAVKQFKKNCKYIDKNDWKMPCLEIKALIANNCVLVETINGNIDHPLI